MLVARQAEREIGPHGIPMSEATDPKNAGKFAGQKAPRVDLAEKARLDAQQRYYKENDKDQKNPMNRNGHIWGVTYRV